MFSEDEADGSSEFAQTRYGETTVATALEDMISSAPTYREAGRLGDDDRRSSAPRAAGRAAADHARRGRPGHPGTQELPQMAAGPRHQPQHRAAVPDQSGAAG